jgi:tetratricopeptide (TPR) repeat protein
LHQYEKAIADYSEAIQLNPKSGYFHNALARLLATCPESRSRDTGRAIELAKKAVQLLPNEGNFWNTLGVAQYREGSFKDAVTSLEKSMEIQNGGKSLDWFFLAMAHWQLGDKDQAERWYGQAVRWMEKNAPQDEELRRFAAEAAELMKKGSGGRSQESAKEPN